MISTATLIAALQARRQAWVQLGERNMALSRMTPIQRQRTDDVSAMFRKANATLLAGVIERRGEWTHDGLTLALMPDGLSLLWSDAWGQYEGHGYASALASCRLANARRFGRAAS